MKLAIPATERFWRYVKKTHTCWEWTGAKTHGGYGVIQAGPSPSKVIRAHRLSWLIHFGDFDTALDVCHKCDTPSCVRPDHLFLGTAKDNVADMLAKGRANGGGARGSRHGRAKLSEAGAIAIRETRQSGMSLNAIAAEFGVSKKTVLNVVRRRIWTHV